MGYVRGWYRGSGLTAPLLPSLFSVLISMHQKLCRSFLDLDLCNKSGGGDDMYTGISKMK